MSGHSAEPAETKGLSGYEVLYIEYKHVTYTMPSWMTLLRQFAQQLHALLHSNMRGGSM